MHPSTFMFFGAPLQMSRSYDLLFKNAEAFKTIHHRFTTYYQHFEGEVEASLCLYNSYLAKRCAIFEKNNATPSKKGDKASSADATLVSNAQTGQPARRDQAHTSV
mmetsp:Transcript_19925/g.34285  ORF Transcript_19925/g.34285 Transcript_19925/m.34285 type:complete len:106 (-) Transcript_19925:685-1002(-)